MKREIVIVICDICKRESPPSLAKGPINILNENVPVIFTTEQTEGRNVPNYFTTMKLDICESCSKIAKNGNPIFARGAQGHNEFWIKDYEKEVTMLKALLKILKNSNGKVEGSAIYNLNPSFQTMKCVSAAIEGGSTDEILDKLERNELIDHGSDEEA